MDYEVDVSPADRREYDASRDPFSATGSPALPQGLNLGVQLSRLEQILGAFPDDLLIVPWPQYWAWRLCGVAASEVTSLGCHTDLWRPAERSFSQLAGNRGWAARMAPISHASDVLGFVTPEIAATTGLNAGCEVLCGIHDSNAALLAARGHADIGNNEATVLSTGTWFIAMRSTEHDVDIGTLDESRDCLVNVDVDGRPTPSARFMGGREAELAGGVDTFMQTEACEPPELLARVPELVQGDVGVMPGFVPGVGPFPGVRGRWQRKPDDPIGVRAAIELYLALVADATLDLIGSRDSLLVEGRFAAHAVFVRALASLRPSQRVFTSNAENDVAHGALRLTNPGIASPTALAAVEPLDLDLGDYAASWRERAQDEQAAA
jgi:sugar (pentulose or hexulose) kinase